MDTPAPTGRTPNRTPQETHSHPGCTNCKQQGHQCNTVNAPPQPKHRCCIKLRAIACSTTSLCPLIPTSPHPADHTYYPLPPPYTTISPGPYAPAAQPAHTQTP